jgi:septal ring factor EnvC (AmiA/AmiB activator)
MSKQLRQALEANRASIEAGLAEAEHELAALHERQRALEALIARAKAALGEEPEPRRPQASRLTLHEAIARVLEENGNRWMTVRELADEVNRKGLYQKRDGSPVEANQIHARTKNYGSLFEKNGPEVRLRSSV